MALVAPSAPDRNQASVIPVAPHVRAAVRGDRQASARLMEEMLPRIRNLIRYLAHNQLDLDDMTQDAVIEVLRSLPTYRGDGQFERWVDRVVVRATFATLRRHRAERLVPVPDAAAAVAAHEELMVVQPDELMNRRRSLRILGDLPPEQSRVMVLHHVLEMSVPEIAAELGVPFETVRSRLRLARHRIRGSIFVRGAGVELPTRAPRTR